MTLPSASNTRLTAVKSNPASVVCALLGKTASSLNFFTFTFIFFIF
nr:MAG TPA: hypothetical protein [Caudoviricetes sp.]